MGGGASGTLALPPLREDDGADEPASAEWLAELDAASGRIHYIHKETGEVRRERPAGESVDFGEERPALAVDSPPTGLFRTGSVEKKEAEEAEEEARRARAAELLQRRCHRCGALLWGKPRRSRVCRHVVCPACEAEHLRYSPNECCVCGITSAHDVDEELRREDSPTRGEGGAVTDEATVAARARLVALDAETAAGHARYVLEVGNTSKAAAGAKFMQRTFVRVLKRLRAGAGAPSARDLIKRVDFNINPSYPAPTARVTKASSRSGAFELERCLGFTFPCFATVHFTADVAPLHVVYYTQVEHERWAARIKLQLPLPGVAETAAVPVTVPLKSAAEEGIGMIPRGVAGTFRATCGSGWVRYASKRRAYPAYASPDGEDRAGRPPSVRPMR